MPASRRSLSKKSRKRNCQPRIQIIHDYYGKPLTSALARSHIVGLFAKRPAWNRIALIQAVVEAHSQAGGVIGEAEPRQCVCNALSGLKSIGVVNNEVIGLWRLVGKLPTTIKHEDQTLLKMEVETPMPREVTEQQVITAPTTTLPTNISPSSPLPYWKPLRSAKATKA